MSKPAAPTNYHHSGRYDHAAFEKAFLSEFKTVPKFNAPSVPRLLWLLGKIGDDPRITDVRWTAYLLATTWVESSHTVRKTTENKDKKGRTHTHSSKVWRNFDPIEEKGHGKGKAYYHPAKVKRLPNGDARITEYDGDQWVVSATTGREKEIGSPERGAAYEDASRPVFDKDDGQSHQYFGRGFVQLTWWSNYAKAGVALGLGLKILHDPNLMTDPEIAYQIMVRGMCTGTIFANNHRFTDYFRGAHTDYVRARNMVNPGAKHANKVEVAKIAERFERALLVSVPKAKEKDKPAPAQPQVAQK